MTTSPLVNKSYKPTPTSQKEKKHISSKYIAVLRTGKTAADKSELFPPTLHPRCP